MAKRVSSSFSVYAIEDGARGKTGRFYYYATQWNASDTSFTCSATDAQAPYFKVVSGSDYHYYVYVGESNFADKTMQWISSNIGAPSGSNANWRLMEDDFKYIITEAIFGSFAHFGSAIINGDWMISQYGVLYDSSNNATNIDSDSASVVIDGVTYNYNNAYTTFDPTSPNEGKASVVNFVPNYSRDLKRGWSYENVAEVRGVFKSEAEDTGSATYLGAASLLFGFRNADIFRISCGGSGIYRNVKIQIGAAESGMTHLEIESRGTVLRDDSITQESTSLIRLVNLEDGTNVRSIVLHKGGIAMTDALGERIIKQKTWDQLLS